MANARPVDIGMIGLIAPIKGIDPQALLPYAGKPLQLFFAEVICGRVVMQLSGGTHTQATEVPSDFESAMAGILLPAELVVDCNGLRHETIPIIPKLNLMRPLTCYTFDALDKSYQPDCICHDSVYRDVYTKKWNSELQWQRVRWCKACCSFPCSSGPAFQNRS
jgi:hypothetical protein